MDGLERVERSALNELFRAPPPALAAELGLATLELDDALAFSIGSRPRTLLFNRVLGLEDEDRVPAVEQWFRARECDFAVSVVEGDELETVLRGRGYERGPTATKFRRPAGNPRRADTAFAVDELGPERADEFGLVAATGFGIPAEVGRWFAAICRSAAFRCFGATDGARLVAGAAMHVAGDHAWFGAAATLPEARRRGAQGALLAARVAAALDGGARTLTVETMDRDGDVAGPSSRNVARAGFQEAYRQQWWVRRFER